MGYTTGRFNTRMRIVIRILLTICSLSVVIFIFSNSAETGTLSGNKSATITETLNEIIRKMGIDYQFSEYIVRKLGHFLEYSFLGFWLMLTLRAYTRKVFIFISWPLFLGLLTATSDEFFQLFISGRSGEVKDVMIDLSGLLMGIIIGLLTILLTAMIWDVLHKNQQDAC